MSERKQFNYSVDGKELHTSSEFLTGAEIKVSAGAGLNFGLFLEAEGRDPDRQIQDAERVDLAKGHRKFYTTPPATFGR